MVIRGDTFTNSSDLQQIGENIRREVIKQYLFTALLLNSLLGRKGNIDGMTDYWDVATFFEMSVLCEDYTKACQAACKMFQLEPPPWYV